MIFSSELPVKHCDHNSNHIKADILIKRQSKIEQNFFSGKRAKKNRRLSNNNINDFLQQLTACLSRLKSQSYLASEKMIQENNAKQTE